MIKTADNDEGGEIPAEMNGPANALKFIAETLSVFKNNVVNTHDDAQIPYELVLEKTLDY